MKRSYRYGNGLGLVAMGERDRDDVELLEAAKFAVMNATSATARAARAKLAATLRRASPARAGLIVRLADKALVSSEFLREMAWITDPVGPARFDRQRQDFAIAMDRLIFELSVTGLKPASGSPAGKKNSPKTAAQSERIVSARSTLAVRLSRWLSGRGTSPEPARRPGPRPGDDNVAARARDGRASSERRGDPAGRST